MPLSIGVSEGGYFVVHHPVQGEVHCVVRRLYPNGCFQVAVPSSWSESLFEITGNSRVEILPGVHVSAGHPLPHNKFRANVVIEAASEVDIQRDEVYERGERRRVGARQV